jgi:O-antigen/teichoic acid export membrane protein
VEYLRIIATAFPFVFLSAAFTGIFNAAGRSKIPFSINGIGLITNIILDPIFIFGLSWGTTGAAIATWLAEATVCILFIYQLKQKKILWDDFRLFTKLKKQYTRHILKIGLPVAALNTLFAFVNMFLGRTATEQGGHLGLMALTTGGQIEAITWNTSQGFSTALSAFVAQNYAARQISRVLKAYRTTLWMTFIFGSFCTFLFICYGNEIFSIFAFIFGAYEFNWSRLNNYGMKFATGDVYVCLNNDVEVIEPEWLTRLVEKAIRKDVGVVGGLLLYEDNTIQHAGVVIGMGGSKRAVVFLDRGKRNFLFLPKFFSEMTNAMDGKKSSLKKEKRNE